MEKVSTYVGLDVHQRDIVVAMLRAGQDEVLEWKVSNEGRGIRRLVRKLVEVAPGEIRCAYEAGPCGYAAAAASGCGDRVSGGGAVAGSGQAGRADQD